jgi:hypothetical protein
MAKASNTAVVSLGLRMSTAALGMCRSTTHRKIIIPDRDAANRTVLCLHNHI